MSQQYDSFENKDKVEQWHKYQNEFIASLSSPGPNTPNFTSDSGEMALHAGVAVVGQGLNGSSHGSVDDEDLFGPLASECTIDTNDVFLPTDLEEMGSDKGHHKVSYENPAALPNFSMLDDSSGKSSDESPDNNFKYPKSLETPEKYDSGSSGNGSVGINSEDLRSILRWPNGRKYDRSQSALEKRDSFRKSRDREYEVPDFDENFLKNQPVVRKSNSLPDLVTMSQPQSLSPRTCPDVAEIHFHSEETCSRQKQREVRQCHSSSAANTSKPKGIVRHISIAETTEELIYNTDDEPSALGKEGRHLSSRESTENDKPPLKSPTDDRRHVLASKSSGYYTGSEGNGSQDKTDDGYSRSTSQISSTVFTSQDSEDPGREPDMGKQSEIGKVGSQQYPRQREAEMRIQFDIGNNYSSAVEPEMGKPLQITKTGFQLDEEKSFEIDINRMDDLAGNLPLVSMQSLNESDAGMSETTRSLEISEEISESMSIGSRNVSSSESLSYSYDSEKTCSNQKNTSINSSGSNRENTSTNSSGSSTQTVIDAERSKVSRKTKEQHVKETANPKTVINLPVMSFTQEEFITRGAGKISMENDGKSTELKSSSTNDSVLKDEESCLDITGEAGAIRKQRSTSGGNMPHHIFCLRVEENENESFSITDNVGKIVGKIADKDDKEIQKFKRKQNLSSGSMETVRSSSSDSPSMTGSPMSAGAQDYKLATEKYKLQRRMCEFEKLLTVKSPSELSPTEVELLLTSMRSPSMSMQLASVREKHAAQELAFSATDLERASRCGSHKCPDTSCRKLSEVNVMLQSEILEGHPSYQLVRMYCKGLWEHAQKCDDTKCLVQYCGDVFTYWKLAASSDDELASQIVFRIQTQMNSPKMGMFLPEVYTFHKLMNKPFQDEPRTFVTHTPLYSLGKFGTATVCMDHQYTGLCVIKSFPPLDYQHHMSLFTRLRGLTHKHMLDQLWLLEYNEQIQVCSPFMPGGSLRDYLDSVKEGLPWEQAVFYLTQAIDAVLYLHTKGVIYLNWQSKNILFVDSRCCKLKLGNFGLSCPLNCEMDLGAIKECLPPYLCPPELIQNNKVDFVCDSWGAGCLLWEMVAGSPPLYAYRHDSRDTVHRKVCTPNTLRVPDILDDMQAAALNELLKVNPSERGKLNVIADYLTNTVELPAR